MYIIWSIFLCFACFIFFDLNDVLWKKKTGRLLFYVGCIGIVAVTGVAVIKECGNMEKLLLRTIVCSIISVIGLFALVYTLFFAFPAEDAYGKNTIEKKHREAYTEGVYALSRHPGVLFMVLIYIGLYGAFLSEPMLVLLLATTVCNVAYVVFQDIWTFPRLFSNYEEYKKCTPFLIPSGKSIGRCIKTRKK